jgi:serine phosphatase RsbU (regulator of sigma subunit)
VKQAGEFRRDYTAAFATYLVDPSEPALRAAYELGRAAVANELSVLELAAIHHDVLLAALGQCVDVRELPRISAAAGDFFLESLAAFEMVQRGYREARETAAVETRHAAALRQLSRFLADASLALHAGESLDEMLQLVAEQARELIGAECCVASVTTEGEAQGAIEAVSLSDARAKSADGDARVSLFKVSSLIDPPGGPARLAEPELADRPAARIVARLTGSDRPLRGRLVASLRGLDGRELGAIHLFDKLDGNFTDVDEAVLLHLADMASAAVERAQLYAERGLVESVRRRTLPLRLPELPTTEIVVRASAATSVSGDWYDVVPFPDGRVGIAVGRAPGRGLPAVSTMAQVRTAFRAFAGADDAPEAVVDRVDALLQTLDAAHFSTMIYMLVDATGAEVRVVRAGHPPPVLVRPGREVRRVDAGLSVPLGVLAEVRREHRVLTVEPGSILLVATGPLLPATAWLEEAASRLTRGDGGTADAEALWERVVAQAGPGDGADGVASVAIRFGRTRTEPAQRRKQPALTSSVAAPAGDVPKTHPRAAKTPTRR